MNRMIPQRSLVALALTLALVIGSVPAYGATLAVVPPGSTVPSHAFIGGTDLFGLTDAAARAKLAAAVPSYKPITVRGNGKTVTFASKSAIYVANVEAMLDQAYSAIDTSTLVPTYAINSNVVSGWSAKVAAKINHAATNAKRKVRGHRLIVTREWVGHAVYRTTTGIRIKNALASEIASPNATPNLVWASVKTVQPKVTRKNIPKAILVVLSHFTVKLYKRTKVEKTYKIAIGMPAYPTPRGKWKVIAKVKNPSWHNPGSAWAASMPSVIGPGPNNPLGTRAIYLSAPGIRFHGTAKWWSIGHAASHGCMRMRRHDVEDFYPRVPVGTTVWIVK